MLSWLCPLRFISAAPPSPSSSVPPDYVTVPLLKASSRFRSARRGSVVLPLPLSACPPRPLAFILPFLPHPLFLSCTMAGSHFKIVLQEYSQYIRAECLCISLLRVCPCCGLQCSSHSSCLWNSSSFFKTPPSQEHFECHFPGSSSQAHFNFLRTGFSVLLSHQSLVPSMRE